MKQTIGISGPGGHAHMLYIKTKNRTIKANDITESQKEAFLKRKTHKCKAHSARVSMKQCQANLERALYMEMSKDRLYSTDNFLKCLSCKYAKKIKKQKVEKPKRKPCKTFEEFGDLCPSYDTGGWAYEKIRPGVAYGRGHFANKLFCCHSCASRYHNLKDIRNTVVGGVMYRWSDRKIK